MQFTVTPLSPTEAITLPTRVPGLESARQDVGLWLSEVQANRCLVDRTCFALYRGEEVTGYLLGLARHGHATCTGLEVSASAPHVAVWQLVHAFMERLVELAVDSADFYLSTRVPEARHLLVQLGAREVGHRDDVRFRTGTRAVFQLALANTRFQGLNFAGRSGASANVPGVPTPAEPGAGPRGGKLSFAQL